MSTNGINQSAISALTGGGTGINNITGAATSSKSKAASEDASAVQNFMDYMKETPAQRFEDQWLKAHGLTQKDLDAMPADKRQAILKQMADDIKRQVQQAAQNTMKKTSGPSSIASAITG